MGSRTTPGGLATGRVELPFIELETTRERRFGGQMGSMLTMLSLGCPFSIQKEKPRGSWTYSLREEAQSRVKNLEVVVGGMFMSSPNSYFETLIPSVTVFGDKAPD